MLELLALDRLALRRRHLLTWQHRQGYTRIVLNRRLARCASKRAIPNYGPSQDRHQRSALCDTQNVRDDPHGKRLFNPCPFSSLRQGSAHPFAADGSRVLGEAGLDRRLRRAWRQALCPVPRPRHLRAEILAGRSVREERAIMTSTDDKKHAGGIRRDQGVGARGARAGRAI